MTGVELKVDLVEQDGVALSEYQRVSKIGWKFFMPYAESDGKTERLCREVINAGKEVYTFQASSSSCLIRSGAKTVGLKEKEIKSLFAIDQSGLSID